MLDSYLSGQGVNPKVRDYEQPAPLPELPEVQYPAAARFQPNRQVTKEQAYEVQTIQELGQQPAPLLDTIGAAIESEWMGAWALRSLGMPEFEPDPEFNINKLPQERQDAIFGGLTTEQLELFQDRLGEAVSYDHALAIRQNLDELVTIQNDLESRGMTGVGLRVLAAMLDPVAIGATVATEGLAAPAIWGARLTRLQRAIRGGLLAGSVNAGMEGLIAIEDPFRDFNDVAIAGAAGIFLGGATGALMGGARPGRLDVDNAIARAAKDAVDQITVEQGVEAGLRSSRPLTRETVSIAEDGEIIRETVEETVSGGSVGAALNPVAEDFLSQTDRDLMKLAQSRRPKAEDVKFQFDMYSQLARSDHPMVAWAADQLTPNPSGVRTSGQAQSATAWEIAQRLYNSNMASMNRVYVKAFKDWLKEQGQGWAGQFVRRDEFASLVGRAVRDPAAADSAAVKKAADAIREVNRSLLEQAKKAGVRGFSEVPENATYLMRVHSLQKLTDMRRRFGDPTIINMLARAIMNASEDLEFDKADALARAYLRTVDRSKWHVDMGSSTMFSSDQREWLKEELTKHFEELGQEVDDDALEAILSITRTDNEGRVSRAKRRLGLDESFRMRVFDPQTGQETTIGVQDILEDNAEVIMQSYVRQMSGAIGMAKKGFKGANDFDNYVNRVRRTAEQVPGMDPQKLEEQLAIMETIKRGVMGQPLTDLNKFASMRRVGRALRDYNFARVMGQVGFAQVAEIGNITGQMGFRATLKHIPALRKVFKRMQNGQLDDDLQRELEAVLAPGVDRLIDQPTGRYGDMDVPDLLVENRVDRALKYTNRAVADLSFMAPINIALERMASRAAVQRFADMAAGTGRKLSKKRMLSLGLDEGTADRVFKQMRKHVRSEEGPITGKPVSKLNLDDWDDVEARDAFVNAIHRWSRRAVQKNDIGDLPMFMTTDMGKIIFQFRSFMLVSWAKQLIHGVRMADFETFASFMGTMVTGALGYGLMTYANSVGRDDQKQFLEERLNPQALAMSAFYRSGWSSLLPTVIDTGTLAVGTDPLFAYARTTGLGSSIFGNPTLDLIDSVSKAGRAVIAPVVNPDYQFSQQDYRQITRALMLQNVTGVRNVINVLGEDLPRFSTYD